MEPATDESPRDSRAAQALRRALRRLTQSELAEMTGISQAHLSRLAAGKRVAQSRRDALALKTAIGVELEWWDESPLSDGEDVA